MWSVDDSALSLRFISAGVVVTSPRRFKDAQRSYHPSDYYSRHQHEWVCDSTASCTVLLRVTPLSITGCFPQRDNTNLIWYNCEVGYINRLFSYHQNGNHENFFLNQSKTFTFLDERNLEVVHNGQRTSCGLWFEQ